MIKLIVPILFLLILTNCSSLQKDVGQIKGNPEIGKNTLDARAPASKNDLWDITIQNITDTDLNFQLRGESDRQWVDVTIESLKEAVFPTNGKTLIRIMTGSDKKKILTYQVSPIHNRWFLLSWSSTKNQFVIQKLVLNEFMRDEHFEEADLINSAL